MYTCLHEASQNGQTCFDPLLFHFPTDDNVFEETEHSFIVGDALKVSPVLAAGVQTFKSYFPAGSWVSMLNFATIITSEEGEWIELHSSEGGVQVHLRPGYMIPW